MKIKDVIAQAEIKILDLAVDFPHEGEITLNIKDINSLFSTYTKDLLQSVEEMGEGMKVDKRDHIKELDNYYEGFNVALSDIISKLK